MRRTWTIIAVRDVFSSLKWYQALLGLTQSTPEHDYFGQVLDADSTVLLCLLDGGITSTLPYPVPGMENPGMACSCFSALTTLTGLCLEEEPHINPGTKTLEFSLLDPDGYYVSISALATA